MPGASWTRGFTILSLLVAIVACQPGQNDVVSAPPESAPWYTLRYSHDVAPLIVQCMNNRGWEATYHPELGALLPKIPLLRAMERDEAIGFCVAGSHTHRRIYID